LIYTLTINPAIDKLIFLERFIQNQTNRSLKTVETIGGKGTHVSLNLNLLNEDNRAILFVSGATGDKLIKMLHDSGVKTQVVRGEAFETRTNIIIVELTNDCTILAERGKPIGDDILDKVTAILRECLREGDCLVLSGDASNCARSIYAEIIREFSPCGVRVFLDASGPALIDGLQEGPFLVKPNIDELSQICGRALGENDINQIVEAMEVFDRHAVSVAAVSLGGQGSLIKQGDRILRAYAPKVDVKNTIGCGDAYMAGLVYGFHNGLSLEDTLVLATAISTATAANESSVGFDVDEVARQKQRVRVEAVQARNRMLE
jgi:1-phosphofructokinase family hexose kinase